MISSEQFQDTNWTVAKNNGDDADVLQTHLTTIFDGSDLEVDMAVLEELEHSPRTMRCETIFETYQKWMK
jgi:hypothetical protein